MGGQIATCKRLTADGLSRSLGIVFSLFVANGTGLRRAEITAGRPCLEFVNHSGPFVEQSLL